MGVVLTLAQNLRDKTNGIGDKEIRWSRYGHLNAFMNQTDSPTGIVTGALKQKAGIGDGFTLEYPVIDENTAMTVGNTRPLVIVDAENTSRMLTISFTTLSTGFTRTKALFHNNELDYEQDFAVKFKKVDKLFAKAANDLCLAKLESIKTKVFIDPLEYSVLADTIVAKYSEREDILGDINVIMRANDFHGDLHVIGNAGFESLVSKLSEKSIYNIENKDRQWNDKKWSFDNNLPNGEGKNATAFVVEADSLGILFQHEVESLNGGKTLADGTSWDIVRLPESGIPASTYFYTSVQNRTGLDGAASTKLDRVGVEHFGFSVNIGLVDSYISDDSNRPKPTLKLQINKSATDSDSIAPTSSFGSSADLTNLVLNFSEVVCSDRAGTVITGDIGTLFSISTGGITSATAAVDGLSVTFVIDPTGLADPDLIAVLADSLYDGAGNVMAAATVANVNAGVTAWEA